MYVYSRLATTYVVAGISSNRSISLLKSGLPDIGVVSSVSSRLVVSSSILTALDLRGTRQRRSLNPTNHSPTHVEEPIQKQSPHRDQERKTRRVPLRERRRLHRRKRQKRDPNLPCISKRHHRSNRCPMHQRRFIDKRSQGDSLNARLSGASLICVFNHEYKIGLVAPLTPPT